MNKNLIHLVVVLFVVASFGSLSTPLKASAETIRQNVNRMQALFSNFAGSQQVAATVYSNKTTSSNSSEPQQVSGGCGQTLTPLGSVNQTIRCDGANWVASDSLLNNGENLGVGTPPSPSNSSNGARISVVHTNEYAIKAQNTSSNLATVYGQNYAAGPGVEGVNYTSTGIGVRGVTDRGKAIVAIADGGVGIESIQGALAGNDSVAVKANAAQSAYGFLQEGTTARNWLKGSLTVGTSEISDQTLPANVKVRVLGGLKLLPSVEAVRPTCADAARGTLWFAQGGISAADTLFVCAKNVNGAYSWRNIPMW